MAKKKNCFVAIGFGPKTDYESGRTLDLDKTYENLIKPKVFKERGDQEWIYQSMALARRGLGRDAEVKALIPKIQKLSKGAFDLETFNEQNKKLIEMMNEFSKKRRYLK